MRRWRYVCDVEGGDVGRVLEDVTELPGETFELILGEVKASEASHVGDVGARDGIGHVPIVDARPVYARRRMAFLCQTCGADPRGSWGSNVPRGDVAEGTCPDCGRSLTPPFARATLNDDDPAVEYEFEDWDAEDRAAAAEALTAKIIPFRWEPGLILAVAAHREGDADAVLDELEDAADIQGGALPEATEGWGEGEDAFAALGNLFDAADRLFHTPTGTTAANDLREAGAVVRGSPPPYGFSPVLWRTAGELATQLESLLGDGSNDDIRAGAEALRDVLAEHI